MCMTSERGVKRHVPDVFSLIVIVACAKCGKQWFNRACSLGSPAQRRLRPARGQQKNRHSGNDDRVLRSVCCFQYACSVTTHITGAVRSLRTSSQELETGQSLSSRAGETVHRTSNFRLEKIACS